MNGRSRLTIEQIVYGNHKRITVTVSTSGLLGTKDIVLSKFDNNYWSLEDNYPIHIGTFSSNTPLTFTPSSYGAGTYWYQLFDPANHISFGYNGIPNLKVYITRASDIYYAEVNAQNGNIKTHGIYSNIGITIPMIEAFDLEMSPLTGTLVSLTSKSISFT